MNRHVTILAGIITLSGCTKPSQPNALFQHGGEMLDFEKRSLSGIHPNLATWPPHYSAVWSSLNVTRRVYLFCNDIASVRERIEVLVFDEKGNLLEGNVIEVSVIGTRRYPRAILGINPLRLGFALHGENEISDVARFLYSPTEGCRRLKEAGEHNQRTQDAIQTWRGSGDTNVQTLTDMLKRSEVKDGDKP